MKNNVTFENVPESSYWLSKSGVVYHCGIYKNTWKKCDDLCDDGTPLFDEGGYNYDTIPNHISISSCNLRVEKVLYYSWDELVAKYEYLGDAKNDGNILFHRQKYNDYKYAVRGVKYCKRIIKSYGRLTELDGVEKTNAWMGVECVEENTKEIKAHQMVIDSYINSLSSCTRK